MGDIAPVYDGIISILIFALLLFVGYAVITHSRHGR